MSRNRFWGSGKGAGPGRGRKALLHEEGRGERRVKRVLHHLKASAVYLFLEVPPEPTGSMKPSQTDSVGDVAISVVCRPQPHSVHIFLLKKNDIPS